MSWRSSYLFCPDCRSVYFANQISPVFENGKTYWHCPNAMCASLSELATIDELMIEPIVKLNKKGYKTSYCCSGHGLRDHSSKYGYILFAKGIKIPSTPKGWNKETDGIGKRVCIRSSIDDLATSISNLNEWVNELEDENG